MKTIDNAVIFNDIFKKFYKDEYISFMGSYIQVTDKKLAKIIQEEFDVTPSLEITPIGELGELENFECKITYMETDFIAIGTKEEFKSVGIIF